MALVKFQQGVYYSKNELKEALNFLEMQETTDKHKSIELIIRGNYADIIVNCDEDGYFIVKSPHRKEEKNVN